MPHSLAFTNGKQDLLSLFDVQIAAYGFNGTNYEPEFTYEDDYTYAQQLRDIAPDRNGQFVLLGSSENRVLVLYRTSRTNPVQYELIQNITTTLDKQSGFGLSTDLSANGRWAIIGSPWIDPVLRTGAIFFY